MRDFYLYVVSLFMVIIVMPSCTYDNEEELFPVQPCDTATVTYHQTVAPIIMQNCFDCHSLANANVSGIPLEGYSNLKAMVDAQRVIGAIRHQVGFSPMPKDRPSLSECDMLKIEKWVSEGALNN